MVMVMVLRQDGGKKAMMMAILLLRGRVQNCVHCLHVELVQMQLPDNQLHQHDPTCDSFVYEAIAPQMVLARASKEQTQPLARGK